MSLKCICPIWQVSSIILAPITLQFVWIRESSSVFPVICASDIKLSENITRFYWLTSLTFCVTILDFVMNILVLPENLHIALEQIQKQK